MAEPSEKQIHDRRRRILRNTVLVGGFLMTLCASQVVCLPAMMEGVWLKECPSGELQQTITVQASDLRRGQEGWAEVRVRANYTTGPADRSQSTNVRQFRTDMLLVDADGEETPLDVRRWDLYGGVQTGHIILPEVADGDYLLRTRVRSAISEDVLDTPLPLFAPATIHILTDRPLYEPGNTVQFRAVALKSADRVPIVGRPGKWMVLNPQGEILLEESVPTGEWGVVAGSFPLDSQAESGDWTVRYVSGQDSHSLPFKVEPFTLPRFRIEASTDAPWYSRGDEPTISGQVVYSSGAPVEEAELEISWTVSGRWPAPTEWSEGGLPTNSSTDTDGNFTLDLPMVPADLVGTVSLRGSISAIDAAGDRVVGSVSALLSADALAASAVTELSDGLVEGFNNRIYLRVTTPSGQPLPGAQITVRRAWDATDTGTQAIADADGVAALQIDPGAPVNIVIPPLPVRPPAKIQPIQRTAARDLLSEAEPVLADRLAMDRWTSGLEPCAQWVAGSGSRELTLGLMIEPSGALSAMTSGDSQLEKCFTKVLSRSRAAPGRQRLLRVSYQIHDPESPTITAIVGGARRTPSMLNQAMNQASLEARSCLLDDTPSTTLPRTLIWRSTEDTRDLDLRWSDQRTSTRLSARTVSCVERVFSTLRLAEDAEMSAMGVMKLQTIESRRISQARPQPTTMLGYELEIAAAVDGEVLGETTMRFSPGHVPSLRIRADTIIAAAGDDLTFELIRGPDFSGELPEELSLGAQDGSSITSKLADRAVTFRLPDDAEGWYTLTHDGAVSRVFVPPPESLSLAMTTEQGTYAPGDTALIELQTTAGGTGVAAAVGLFGVDESLSQLATLPDPGSMSDALIEAPTLSPAFGVLDGTALVMGRIQGENAAAAAVLQVSAVPTPAELDRPVSVYDYTHFDPVEDLTDHFYIVLAELHVQARSWERAAAEDEQMSPAIMAGLWDDALEACRAREEDVSDAFGRPLRLHRLPSDLLAMTAPHEVVLDGTRLPEDVENWHDWVAQEQP